MFPTCIIYELLVSYCVDQTIDAFSILSLVYIVTLIFSEMNFLFSCQSILS